MDTNLGTDVKFKLKNEIIEHFKIRYMNDWSLINWNLGAPNPFIYS